MTADLDTLAAKADDLARKFREPATFELVRACLNEAGITRARRDVFAATDAKEAALRAKRTADTAERNAREALDKALSLAEWELEPPVAEKRDGKTFVNGEEVVSWLAADKKAWKQREAAKQPTVVAAAETLRAAEHDVAVARDAVSTAGDRFKACCADLDAAVATLNALREALPARKAASA